MGCLTCSFGPMLLKRAVFDAAKLVMITVRLIITTYAMPTIYLLWVLCLFLTFCTSIGVWLQPLPFFSEPSKTLMLGMGGGVLPCFFLHYFPKMSVSVVDINEKIFEGAKAGMMCPTDDVAHRFHAIVADGVEFVRDAKEKYDIIIMDVSCGVSWSDIKFGLEPCVPPLAFTKKEVLASIAKMTKGIFIMHIWDDPETYVIETRQILRGLFKGGGFLHFRSEGSHIQIYWKDDLGPFLPQEVLEQSPITIKTAGLEKIWRSGTASIQEWINSNIAADMYWHGKKRGA
mmetsp:Transcript_32365/g.52323  ORF Transcript_32365/g.52323 Transcript_32365/m.52323 type:complete len:287 (+) Transcript_32365:466-1326(+)